MPIAEKLLPEFEKRNEVDTPAPRARALRQSRWKPHQKSFALRHLAQLVGWMPGWVANAIRETELNLAGVTGYSFAKSETLLDTFDKNVKDAKEAIAASKDEDYAVTWSLKHGDQVLMSMPREQVVRQHISHLVHRRGQLTVYLRLVDVPIPSIYGPTADEKWGPTA